MKKLLLTVLAAGCTALAVQAAASQPRLLRLSHFSAKLNVERDYFVYLPPDFEQQERWPVILFLHGNGERGDGKAELDYVLKHGPLFEAWCQRRDLPFVIISPQMPMHDQGEVPYIKHRTRAEIPERKADGSLNVRPFFVRSRDLLEGQIPELPASANQNPDDNPRGWNTISDDVMAMLDHVMATYKGDPKRVYLTGISLGGFGTWYLAAKHPDRFAAIVPVVGFGVPSQAAPIAAAKLPLWVIAGGRDSVVKVRHFYPLLNELEKLGHPEVRFTIEADMGHDAWIRTYMGQDVYDWMLQQSK